MLIQDIRHNLAHLVAKQRRGGGNEKACDSRKKTWATHL